MLIVKAKQYGAKQKEKSLYRRPIPDARYFEVKEELNKLHS